MYRESHTTLSKLLKAHKPNIYPAPHWMMNLGSTQGQNKSP